MSLDPLQARREVFATGASVLIALAELGVREIAGATHEERILAYHATTTLGADSDEVPWCSAFVNWCVEQAGLEGTRSAAARSWLDWGTPVERPRLGDLVVLARGGMRVPWRPGEEPSGADGVSWVPGHVGFFVDRVGADLVQILGGNQQNRVSIRRYPATRVVGFRRGLGA